MRSGPEPGGSREAEATCPAALTRAVPGGPAAPWPLGRLHTAAVLQTVLLLGTHGPAGPGGWAADCPEGAQSLPGSGCWHGHSSNPGRPPRVQKRHGGRGSQVDAGQDSSRRGSGCARTACLVGSGESGEERPLPALLCGAAAGQRGREWENLSRTLLHTEFWLLLKVEPSPPPPPASSLQPLCILGQPCPAPQLHTGCCVPLSPFAPQVTCDAWCLGGVPRARLVPC